MATLGDFLNEWHNERPYIKAHTSGSTGQPKEIRLLKTDMIESAKATNRFFGINSSSLLGIPLSMDYIAGKMMAVRAIQADCRLIEMPVSNHLDINERIDLLSVVPTQLDSLLNNQKNLSLVGNLLIGGAPLSDSMEKAVAQCGIKAWIGYGMTETCSHVALRKVGGDKVFHAMPDIRFGIDCRGCLVIESNIFSWKELVTNDAVELLSKTSFKWLGRIDNVVNSGGIKLHPERLEDMYRSAFPSMPLFYLTGESDSDLGQRLVMVAENPPDYLLESLRKAIPEHSLLPKRIIAVQSLPKTSNGKLRRLPPESLLF